MVNSRGYLHENYRLFHTWDRSDTDFQTHCHDFHKILLCLNGHVTYIMEGVTYYLRPWDLMIIPEHQIHQSIFDSSETYERMVLWINDSFLKAYGEEATLRYVFEWPLRRGCGLFQITGGSRAALLDKLQALEQCQKETYPGHQLMADTHLLQFLLTLRGLLSREESPAPDSVRSDPRFSEMLFYINHHLSEDLSVEQLSKRFFLSPSYLMHQFKAHTGLTVHQYVVQKRLIGAHQAILAGAPVVESAERMGFGEYSTFLRAFRKMFGCLPSEIRK